MNRAASITPQAWAGLAALGSALLLGGAFVFHSLGYAPCPMCIWQRYPHAVAIAIGVMVMILPGRALPMLGALAALCTGVIGVFHTGVERGWWQGPSTCAGGGDISAMSPADLLAQIMEAPLVRCDEVAWQMLGLSMASWNAVASFALAGLWLYAATRPSPK